ncbi:MAG: hypothetical protein Q8R60_09770 [Mycobacteriales bacterium]|nr:hypothetical protein [Mycobacteriales bacterium]
MPAARWRAIAGAAALAAVVPAVAPWTAPSVSSYAKTGALTCGTATEDLPWQATDVPAFRGVEGSGASDRIANYAVQSESARRQLVTNGVTVQSSTTNGCSWQESFTFTPEPGVGGLSAVTARITAAALLKGGRGLLAVREGSGASSRPRVLGASDGTGGGWATSEQGLPAQGSPGVLAPADNGRTVYLSISPTGAGGDDGGGTLPPLPGVPGGQVPTPGLVYASTDGGRTWGVRTEAGDLPGGDRAITDMAVDRRDPDLVYAIAGGQLLRSDDGARTFEAVAGASGRTAVVAMDPGEAAAFGADGSATYSSDGMATTSRTPVPGGITSAAYRDGSDLVAVESDGDVALVDPRTGATIPAKAKTPPRAGTLTGDQSGDSTFHAIAGHTLIRYVDPLPPGTDPVTVPPPQGNVPPTPPRAGSISPPSAQLELEQGDSRKVDYVLTLPENPTPLDVMYLVDTSPTMLPYIKALRENTNAITNALARDKIDVNVGLAFFTTGPSRGSAPYPVVDPGKTCDEGDTELPYVKPEVFKLLARISEPGPDFAAKVNQLRVRCVPSTATVNKGTAFNANEAQVLALDQLLNGEGVDIVESQGALTIDPGQRAGWRQNRFIRRVIVHATDEPFVNKNERPEWPAGSPETAAGELDVQKVIDDLKEQKVLHLGIDPSGKEAISDLKRVALGTGTVAPKGGAVCDPKTGVRTLEGDPLVCGSASDFRDALVSLLKGLVDRQDVTLNTTTGSNAVGSISAAGLKGVNVSVDNTLRFSVTYSCADIPPGKYLTTLESRLRGTKVAVTRTNLRCVKAAARVIRPLPEVEPAIAPPPQPVQPALPPPAPPAPAAQPQVQPQAQVQVQVNPMTAAMLEQQEQLQLALALNGTERPTDDTELAMVDRQSRRERGAQVVLLASMAMASVAGVRRLRTQQEHGVRRIE